MNIELGFVHRFIPSKNPRNKRTILLLHGTGGNENYMLKIGRVISPGASYLSPRGRIFEQGLNKFCIRKSDGKYDLNDLRMRTSEMVSFVINASRKYKFDLNTISILGYSNGGTIAASVILTQPGMIKRSVLFHPGFPFIPDDLPDLSNSRILITSGEIDDIVRPEESVGLAKLLKRCRADIEIFKHKKGHELVKDEIYEAKNFLKIKF